MSDARDLQDRMQDAINLAVQYGRAMKVVEAARRWHQYEWGGRPADEIRESRRDTVDELDNDDADMALIDALAALDAVETET